ncbi:MAG TPA: hypothetical protein VH062_37580 [Polyangiaceae bacterium]|nr:hypothetical protein [Polyangiaceae bacterium]
MNALLYRLRALLRDVPLDTLDLLGRDRAHVIADVSGPDRLKQGDEGFVIEPEITRDFVHAKLTHRTSTTA